MSNDRHQTEYCRRFRWLLFWLGVSSFFLTVPLILASDLPKEVLLLHSERSDWEVNILEDRAIRSALKEGWPGPLDIYSEYMGPWELLAKPDYEMALHDFLGRKYKDRHFDVIIGVAEASLRFLRNHGGELFPNTPIVAFGGKDIIDEWGAGPPITAVVGKLNFKGTADLILHLHPDLRQLIVLSGNSPSDHFFETLAKQELLPYADRVTVTYMSGLRLEEIQTRVSNLPQHSAILLITISGDGTTRKFLPDQVVAPLVKSSNAPIYGIAVSYLGKGIVGGSLLDQEGMGREAADLALRILRGERARDIPVYETKSIVAMVDWQQLRRWGIRESKLPPGTIVRFREPTPWDKYRPYILLALLVLTLQLAVILYLLVERRRRLRSQALLAERLRFETLLAEVASSFSIMDEDGLNYPILQCLRAVHDFFDVNLASIWQFQQESGGLLRTHVWPEDAAMAIAVSPERLPHTIQCMARGETVHFADEIERSRLKDFEAFRDAGIKSFLAYPLQSDKSILRVLALIGVSKKTFWPSDIVTRLRMIANILGHVLARQSSARALRDSEILKGSILESLQNNVCVIDKEGFIVEVNRSWVDFAVKNSMQSPTAVAVGNNYLWIIRNGGNSEETTQIRSGVLSVLDGSRQHFEMEYPCHSPTEQRWLRMTASRLFRPEGGAVISHVDITTQKLAEFEQQKMKEEAAQLNRANEMGQLVASLAHELAQPLAAVLSNAQAASRLASYTHPDLIEIKNALADIIDDEQRAIAVLNHVRAILKKHTVVPHQVNLNEIVEDVILIVRNNAQLRGVQLKSALNPDAILVRGDEVPLQQVLLNLVLNAMDAVADLPSERKLLTVKTSVNAGNASGLLVVEDEGPGVPDSLRARLFTPFFTTKNEGLGMGLAICSEILTSLGGSIEFQNRSERGATFQVELPLAA